MVVKSIRVVTCETMKPQCDSGPGCQSGCRSGDYDSTVWEVSGPSWLSE